jgi:fructose-specific phosphotransferase system IIC component
MVEPGVLVGLITLMIVLLIVFEVISFIFWLNMLTDALKKRDTLWIALLIVGFLSGVLSGLFAALYYEIMYMDEQGHRKSNQAFTFMVISFILFCVVSLIFLIIILKNGVDIINTLSNSLTTFYSMG